MKTDLKSVLAVWNQWWINVGIVLILVVTGCSKSSTPTTDTASADDIRGEPIAEIRGEPIAAATEVVESTISQTPPSTLSPGSETVATASTQTPDEDAPPEIAVSVDDSEPQNIEPTSPAGISEQVLTGPIDTEVDLAQAPGVLENEENVVDPSEGSDQSQDQAEQITPASDELTPISFEKLASFEYEMPDDLLEPETEEAPQPPKDQIPPQIRAFNETMVSLKGYMLPLKVENRLVTEMLIMRDQSMCCYGTVPKINEWVSVKMTNDGVKPVMDVPVTIEGKLRVGEIRENGYLVGIYEMDGTGMQEVDPEA